MPWAQIFDQSFQRVPAANYAAMYAAGYRVMAGYVAGGSAAKWITATEIRAWLACGPGTGFLPLFEASGDEPVTSPGSGPVHARAARAGARTRGVPDTVAISPAMDRNVTMAQAQAAIATYMRGWKSADTMPPLPYIEADAGAYLHTAGLTVGTGTPAAYSWDLSNQLVTPANAPAHVLWTQERNGVALHGGNVDTGHIRTTAPIWWPNTTTTEDAMTTVDLGKATDGETYLGKIADIWGRTASIAGTQIADILTGVASIGSTCGQILDAVKAIPTTATPAAALSDDDVLRIANKTADVLSAREAS